MSKKNKRSPKRIKSKLSSLPIQEVGWRDYLPELLLLGDLGERLEGLNALEIFGDLRAAILNATGYHFDGSVRSWNEFASAVNAPVAAVVSLVSSSFLGTNAALFRRFPLSRSDQVLATINEQDPGKDRDWVAIMRLVGHMWDHQGRAATRAKALHLWAILSKGEYSASSWDKTRSEIKCYLQEPIPENVQSIRAVWLMRVPEELIPSQEWAIEFWSRGLSIPCIPAPYHKPTQPPWPSDSRLVSIESDLDTLIGDVLSGFRVSLDYPVYEVLGGLLARIRSLTSFILDASARDEGEAAEIFLRCLADTNITVRWLLKQKDRTIYLRFQRHSYEHEKHAVDTLQEAIREDNLPEEWIEGIHQEYDKVHETAGRWPELMDVTLGPWNDISIAKMARELGTDAARGYTIVFGRASDAVHGTWRNLRRFHLDRCLNPLHQGHHLPNLGGSRSAGLTPVVGALMLTSEAVVAILESIAPTEATERKRANEIYNRLKAWVAENFNPTSRTWKVEYSSGKAES